jgi:hypothetical protein
VYDSPLPLAGFSFTSPFREVAIVLALTFLIFELRRGLGAAGPRAWAISGALASLVAGTPEQVVSIPLAPLGGTPAHRERDAEPQRAVAAPQQRLSATTTRDGSGRTVLVLAAAAVIATLCVVAVRVAASPPRAEAAR